MTVIWPFLRIPKVNSDVLVKRGAVPVPLAGELGGGGLGVLGGPEELEAEPLDEDEAELAEGLELPVMPCSALWTAAESSELTRFKAV